MQRTLPHCGRATGLVLAAFVAACALATGPASAAPPAKGAPPWTPGAETPAPAGSVTPAAPGFVEGELLVRFRPFVPSGTRAMAHAETGARRVRGFRGVPGLEQVRLPEGVGVRVALASYRRRPDVLYAEPNHIAHADGPPEYLPDDPFFPEQWALRNTGQDGRVPDADMDVPEAWSLIASASAGWAPEPVVVGVIDTGVDWTHEDLASVIWTNPGETPGNGIDDDSNGYVDDVRGIDLVDDDVDPRDEQLFLGHGTHVSGSIGAAGDNATGIAGVTWDAEIMPVRVLNQYNSGSYADIIAGIGYADAMGADVINLSLGGTSYSQALYDAIAAFDGLACCAAGNDGTDNDTTPQYPASFDLANVLAVGASSGADQRSSYSNYGATAVDVFAPGDDIVSTLPTWERVFDDDMSTLDAWDTSRYISKPWVRDTSDYITAPSSAAHLSYVDNEVSWLVTQDPIDLTGATRAGLRYNYNMDVESIYDALLVVVSEDETFTADEVVVRSYGRYPTYWFSRSVDLKAWAGKQVYVAFGLTSDESVHYGGVRVDDVRVYRGSDESTYGLSSGTSMATPHAAGLAALLLSQDPALSTAALKTLIMDSAEPTAALAGLCVTGARIDAYGARDALGDVHPPTTTASLAPSEWTSSDVTVTLTATDTQSGVAASYYRLGAGGTVAYATPFAVTAEGTTAVSFWSVDESGNVEPTNTATARIDRTPPETVSDAQATYDGTATISLVASDALSGVAWSWYSLDGGAWTTGTVATVVPGGDHTLEFRSVDVAGNLEETRSASFHVVGVYTDEVPAGTDVTVVSESGVVLSFEQVDAPGQVTITKIADDAQRLAGYWFLVPGSTVEIVPTAVYSGLVTVTVPYEPPTAYGGAEKHLKLFHGNSWGWDEITVGIDTAANTVTGRTASFSPFAVGYSPWEPTSTSNAGSLPTPHKDYATNTNKCAVCHAVHSAYATGTVLLPTTALNACTYCHVDTAIGIRRIYAGVSTAYTYDATVTPFGGGFAHDTSGVACVECHSVHGAMTLNGGNTTKILKDWTQWRSASGAMDDYSTFALAKWPAPVSVADKYGQQTAWCTGCHKYFVESYETTVQVTDAGSWMFVKSHVMTAAAGAYANPVASTVATVAFAPSATCRNCHDAGSVDTTGGVVPSSFPHYTPDNYRFMGVGESVAASGSDNTTGTIDGLCLKCHRDGSGQGAGLSF